MMAIEFKTSERGCKLRGDLLMRSRSSGFFSGTPTLYICDAVPIMYFPVCFLLDH